MSGASSPSDAATFVIELPSGRRVAAELDPHTLIFMLGDGIEQLVNPHLRAAGRSPLRPVPHAVEMRARAAGAARAWYGRLVLPPAALIAPAHGGAPYVLSAGANSMAPASMRSCKFAAQGTVQGAETKPQKCLMWVFWGHPWAIWWPTPLP